MKEEIIISDKRFKTKKELTSFTRNLIGTDRCGVKLHRSNFLYDLITHHPDYAKKIRNKEIDFLYSGPNKFKGRSLFIAFKDGTRTDISWIKCIKKSNSSYSYKMNMSLRESIKEQILDFRSKLGKSPICYLCGKVINQKYDQLHIDHVIRFRDLVIAYNSRNSHRRPDKFKDGIGYEFKNKKMNYVLGWQEFHKQNAVLAPTHSICNTKRG